MRRVLGLGVIAAALAAAPAQAAVVAVTNSGLRDPETRIFTGQRVTFTNLTGAAVAVDSVGRPSFDDLALLSGGEGERRYIRPGRYRYTAAGRDGAIIVQAFARSPKPRPVGPAGCGGRKVFRYDITVKGRKSMMETWPAESRDQGAFSVSYNYLVNYPGVLVAVTDECGRGTTIEPAVGRDAKASGTGSLVGYTWSDGISSKDSGRPPSCAFATAVTGLGAQVSIQGFISEGVGGAFITSGLTTPQFGVLQSILQAKHDGVCNKDPGLSNSSVFDGLGYYDAASTVGIFSTGFDVSGGTLEPPNIGLVGEFTAQSQRTTTALARKLALGRSFSVTTARTFEGTSSQTTARGTASISISLRRR